MRSLALGRGVARDKAEAEGPGTADQAGAAQTAQLGKDGSSATGQWPQGRTRPAHERPVMDGLGGGSAQQIKQHRAHGNLNARKLRVPGCL